MQGTGKRMSPNLMIAAITASLMDEVHKLSNKMGDSVGTSSPIRKSRSGVRQTRLSIEKMRNKKAHKLGRRNHRH